MPRELGGLGVRKLVSFNQASLGKWLWRYDHETSCLWRRVIAMKYGEGKGGWCTRACSRAHGCGLWWSISEGWETFAKHFSFMVGDGSRILFWHDRCGLGSFLSKFCILSYFCVQLIRRLAFQRC